MKQYNLGVVGGIGTTCMILMGEIVNSGFLKDIFVNDDFGRWWLCFSIMDLEIYFAL